MKKFIPEKQYLSIVKQIPIFCLDFQIKCKDHFLLIKRKDEPLKGSYWIIGGRLLINEGIEEAAKRIQIREIGRYFSNFKIIGFSNFMYQNSSNSRATHTPTLLFEIESELMFEPKLDISHTNFKWTKELPKKMRSETIFFQK